MRLGWLVFVHTSVEESVILVLPSRTHVIDKNRCSMLILLSFYLTYICRTAASHLCLPVLTQYVHLLLRYIKRNSPNMGWLLLWRSDRKHNVLVLTVSNICISATSLTLILRIRICTFFFFSLFCLYLYVCVLFTDRAWCHVAPSL